MIDGVKLHEDTKSKLEIYARENKKFLVKPFILVVAKNTEHSKILLDFIKSEDFFDGRYADKVIEINSALRGAEKDSNIEQLLSLESPENKIEIVIHVNMLKEGWDVTNLYTIVPLRTSASETLTEQTIGRGLRLPYGERTGVDEVDRLSIVSHEKYAEIINLANDENSLVRKVYFIEEENFDDGAEKEIVESKSKFETFTQSENFISEIATDINHEKNFEIAEFVAKKSVQTVENLNRQVKNLDAINDSNTKKFLTDSIAVETVTNFPTVNKNEIKTAVQKSVELCVKNLTENIIPIPRAVIQPSVTVKQKFQKFKLDTKNICWQPADESLLGTELIGGKNFEIESDIEKNISAEKITAEIVQQITSHDNIDYAESSKLIFALIEDARNFFKSYLSEVDAEKVMRDRQKSLAEEIYRQINANFYHEEISFTAEKILPFVRIEQSYFSKNKSDKIYNLDANLSDSEVPTKIFQGCKKSCHIFQKFDSNTERIFARILERDSDVLKWLRPATKQFDIFYQNSSRYEPDFVVETADKIFLVEVKKKSELQTEDVKLKASAAKIYCETATDFNKKNGGKHWEYILLPHDEVKLNYSFKYLLKNKFQNF